MMNANAKHPLVVFMAAKRNYERISKMKPSEKITQTQLTLKRLDARIEMEAAQRAANGKKS